MQQWGLNRVRETYLQFFESKGHLRLPSFSLIPVNDPSVLLINAGMTPLKPYFTGAEVPPALRVATCQKCIRTPDIENVGRTSRHGTFFEMLGNFSFGDYFKQEAITWAWELVTDVYQMDPDKLYVSVFHEDDEAYDIWHDTVGLPPSRIFRLGKEDNFWEHGIGPCGPCSEIFYDRGPETGCGDPDCTVGCDCDRFVEFWNLVFTQFYREEDGSYTQLEQKNIDTGAGLERVAAILQGVDNLFEVDTIQAILQAVCSKAGVEYGQDEIKDISIRVITDHIRSTVMMIGDGVVPTNEGRGYVLRRLLRRAARYGLILGIRGAFLHELADVVIQEFGAAYPELAQDRDRIVRQIRTEENRFAETISQGLALLEQSLTNLKNAGRRILDGAAVFKLHDTYGFPFDLTREIASEHNLEVDIRGFQAEMARQRERAREALREKVGSAWNKEFLPESLDRSQPTIFTGYDTLRDQGRLLAIIDQEDLRDEPEITFDPEHEQMRTLVFDRTPFYGESGGQTGDVGTLAGETGEAEVVNTLKTADGIVLHQVVLTGGKLAVGDLLTLSVNAPQRLATARNHTATHLLHQALKLVLGDHVSQSGSFVGTDRLRFDFHHDEPVSRERLQQIEWLVNQQILSNKSVETRVMSLDQAKAEGAVALFGEKYASDVRVVSVDAFSKELCGGTHLQRTSEACYFRILSEGGISAGVRRIEAVTGEQAMMRARQEHQLLQLASALVRSPFDQVATRIENLIQENKQLEKRLYSDRQDQVRALAAELAQKAEVIQGTSVIVEQVSLADAEELRETGDRIRDLYRDAVIVLASTVADKVLWLAMATRQAVEHQIHAGQLVREAARITGGGGGGRPDMAQAGGKDLNRIDEALTAVRQMIQDALEKKEG